MKPIRETIAARARRALAQRHLSPEDAAKRAELHPRTVRRLIEGATFCEETIDALASAIRVDLVDCECHEGGMERREPAEIGTTISGWKMAARVLRVPERTLRDQRDRTGDTHGPWWPSTEALVGWYERLTSGGVASVATTPISPPVSSHVSPIDTPSPRRRQKQAIG
jgi:hypothetical protein